MVELNRRTIEERELGDWAMAYREGGEAAGAAMRDAVSSLTANLPDPNIRALFTGSPNCTPRQPRPSAG